MKTVGSKIWRTEFEGFVECKEGKYFDFFQVCDEIVKCKAEGLEIEIEDKRDKGEFYASFGGRRYSVRDESIKSEHRYGDGGEFEFKTFLREGEKSILVSRLFESYGTYLDDSMDYSGIKVRDTYLFEEDLLGREIFARL